MPAPLAGVQVDGHDAFAEQAVAVTVPAVPVVGRLLHRQENQLVLKVHADLRPHARVARIGGRIAFPGIRTVLAFHRDRVEDPQALAGAHVVAANVAFLVAHAYGARPDQVRGADNDHVPGHDRCGRQTDLAGDQVHVLIGLEFQVGNASLAECRVRNPCDGVQRDHPVALGDVEDAGPFTIAPPGQSAPGLLAGCDFSSFTFVLPVQPKQFAGRRIEGHYRAAASRGGVDHATRHQGRGLEIEFRRRTEGCRIETPGDFKIPEILRIDLIVRRVAGVGQIAPIGQPFTATGIETLGEGGRTRVSAKQHRNEPSQRGAAVLAGATCPACLAPISGPPARSVSNAFRRACVSVAGHRPNPSRGVPAVCNSHYMNLDPSNAMS